MLGEGRGAAGRRCRVPAEPALVRGASDGEVGGQRERFCQGRDQDLASLPKTILAVDGASDRLYLSSSLLPSLLGRWSSPDCV